ncbi:hypothetical protein EON77_01335 [bacterium]|nr:MAG: hypothetical protein EON77_01335 [bacterium]
MRLPKAFARRARKVFFFLHLWTGVVFGLWLVTMGLTGVALAWRSELMGLEAQRLVGQPTPAAGARIISPSQAAAALKAAHPDLQPEFSMFIPPREYGTYLHFGRGGGEGQALFIVDPVTAKVYPPIDRSQLWIDWAERLHADLLLEAKGAVANAVFNGFAFVMLVSGILLWWPSTLKALRLRLTVRRRVSLKRTVSDLHNVAGIYLAGVLVLLAVTAFGLFLNRQTENGIGRTVDGWYGMKTEPRARRGRPGGARRRPTPPAETAIPGNLDLDTLAARAQAAVPNAVLTHVAMPRRAGDPFGGSFLPIGFDNGLVQFDARTGAILPVQRSFSPGTNATRLIGDLHYGWFGGYWSKWLYTFAGLMPVALFVTGLWMWFLRKRSERRAASRKRARGADPIETEARAPKPVSILASSDSA